ncbi:hypothetical protein [Tahibacter sp.]|uniref:hypothetical protein n=1 Tax=Tahibacter sp. TaxID=2056211 RepID=UPI0028C44B6F|nr:hypothetical protein [Tahibacter sp.]
MNNDANNRLDASESAAIGAAANPAFSTSRLRNGAAAHRLLVLGAFSLAAALSLSTAHAQPPLKQKTTGSNIVRSVEKNAGDDVRLEPVEVMLGAVLDARGAAREADDEPSALPDLPVLSGDAFLDDAALAATQPKR